MEKKHINTKFGEFLNEQKDEDIARKIGVAAVTVQYWRLGRTRPSLSNALQLVDISNGRLCLQDLLEVP